MTVTIHAKRIEMVALADLKFGRTKLVVGAPAKRALAGGKARRKLKTKPKRKALRA